MVFRILQFLIGLALAGGGGFLAWTHRADAAHLFPPGVAGLPVLLLAGVLGMTTGVVFLVSALHPRPNQRRLAAEKAAREDAALGEAEAYYSQRARAADRDWRSGDILPLAPPAPPPAAPPVAPPVSLTPPAAPSPVAPPAPPVAPPVTVVPPPVTVTPPVVPEPAAAQPPPAEARPQRSLGVPPPAQPAAAPAAAPKPAAPVKPAASGTPPPPSPFPAKVTLAPIPRASEPPPPPPPQPTITTSAPIVTPDDPHAEIRAAISSGRLDDADRMLAASRDTATGIDLARLTALAGDHAAVSGRQSHAKWLWRLALKRFGELDAMNTPAAKAVAESLRQAG